MRDVTDFDILTMVIDEYEHHEGIPGAVDEATRIAAMLTDLGGTPGQWQSTSGRDLTRIGMLLADWASPPEPRSSVLVWLGHGEARGNEAWLAVRDTRLPMRATGFTPRSLAEHLVNQWRRRTAVEGVWTLVVIEACGADTFVRLLAAALLEQDRPAVPERLAIIGVGGADTNYLGDFSDALGATLRSFTDNDRVIRLKDLVGRLEDRISPGRVVSFGLHDATPLRPVRVITDGFTGDPEVYHELRRVLQQLPADIRSHFVPKAQGAEHGELAWYFVGRNAERTRIAGWLRQSRSGMLVVTGRAGAGKSALLGNVLVYANAKLQDIFQKAGPFDQIPQDEQPPEDAIHAAIHLTGLTSADLIARVALAAGVELPPGEPRSNADWLLSQLARRSFTLMADALDEAQDPVNMASQVLRRIALLPSCRVIVGTRASTTEGPDHPDTDAEDLLEALGRSPSTIHLVVRRDQTAIGTYLRRRLTAAREGQRINCTDEVISSLADRIAGEDREFLYARLAVHEVLAQPTLLASAYQLELDELLRRDHRTLFGIAVNRLAMAAPINESLLEALALARGRGLPRADRIWAIVATALAGGAQVTERDIDQLLNDAAPYVMLDVEEGQSVYRLAHRTFREYFEARIRDG